MVDGEHDTAHFLHFFRFFFFSITGFTLEIDETIVKLLFNLACLVDDWPRTPIQNTEFPVPFVSLWIHMRYLDIHHICLIFV